MRVWTLKNGLLSKVARTSALYLFIPVGLDLRIQDEAAATSRSSGTAPDANVEASKSDG
jgi:hypothetical protein